MSGQQSGYGCGIIGGRHNGRHVGLFSGNKRDLYAKKTTAAPPSEWDEDFLAFWARTTGTPDAWKEAYNQLFLDLKEAGIYQVADVIRWTAAHNEADARLNLMSSSSYAVAYNSPTFTQKLGFQGNGISSYIDENFNPNIDGVNYQIGNASMFVHSNNNIPNVTQVLFGVYYGSASSPYYAYLNTDMFLGGINGGGYNTYSPVYPLKGICSLTRNNTTNFDVSFDDSFYNLSQTIGYASSTPSIFILAGNNGSAAQFFSTMQYSFSFIGGYLTHEQILQAKIIDTNMKSRIAAL